MKRREIRGLWKGETAKNQTRKGVINRQMIFRRRSRKSSKQAMPGTPSKYIKHHTVNTGRVWNIQHTWYQDELAKQKGEPTEYSRWTGETNQSQRKIKTTAGNEKHTDINCQNNTGNSILNPNP